MKDKNTGYTIALTKEYALKQLKSFETPETVIMLALTVYMCVIFTVQTPGLYSIIVFVLFIALSLFGLSETVPALIMLTAPFKSGAFRMKLTVREKQEICAEIDRLHSSGNFTEFTDLLSAGDYLILHGRRNMEVLRWKDIAEVSRTEYPSRKKYKGVFFLKFTDRDGRRHVLDIQNGKQFNPVKQVSLIFRYIEENHPEIRMELNETDRQRIRELSAGEEEMPKQGQSILK